MTDREVLAVAKDRAQRFWDLTRHFTANLNFGDGLRPPAQLSERAQPRFRAERERHRQVRIRSTIGLVIVRIKITLALSEEQRVEALPLNSGGHLGDAEFQELQLRYLVGESGRAKRLRRAHNVAIREKALGRFAVLRA